MMETNPPAASRNEPARETSSGTVPHDAEDPSCRQHTCRDRRRLPPEDRRNQVLDAALAVFAQNGFGPASMNDVAEAAGVTKGCLYHHFASKEALLLALMRERTGGKSENGESACCGSEPSSSGRQPRGGQQRPVEQLATSYDATATPDAAASPLTRDDAIATLVRQMWHHFQQPGQLELTTLAINELPKAPEIARVFFDEVVARGRETLHQTLCDMPQNGNRRSGDETTTEISATIVPYLVMGAALGLRMFHGIDPTVLSAEQVERTLAKILVAGL